jgi:hypothetical protein
MRWIQQPEIGSFDSCIKHLMNYSMKWILKFDIFIKFNNIIIFKINEHLIKIKNEKLFKQSILVECKMNCNFIVFKEKLNHIDCHVGMLVEFYENWAWILNIHNLDKFKFNKIKPSKDLKSFHSYIKNHTMLIKYIRFRNSISLVKTY